MTGWTIEPIPLYRFASPGPEVLFQRDFGEMIDMVIYAFLVQGGGETILVDTGLPEDFIDLNKAIRHRKGAAAGFHGLGMTLAEQLRQRGVVPSAIVLTSLGPYAAGGVPDFPGIPVHVSARGLADLARAEEPALIHMLPQAVRAALATARAFAGMVELRAGLWLVETAIHHPASAAIVVQTGDGAVAIADPVFIARNLVEGLALGAAEHAAGWHGLVRHLGTLAGAILPIHDPDPTPISRDRWHNSIGAS